MDAGFCLLVSMLAFFNCPSLNAFFFFLFSVWFDFVTARRTLVYTRCSRLISISFLILLLLKVAMCLQFPRIDSLADKINPRIKRHVERLLDLKRVKPVGYRQTIVHV